MLVLHLRAKLVETGRRFKLSDYIRQAERLESRARLLLNVSVLLERSEERSQVKSRAFELKEQASEMRQRASTLVQ
jgi:hypothetical protein